MGDKIYNNFYNNFLLGALLHDIGKLFERTKEGKFSHEEQGYNFLFNSKIPQEVAEYARYHHKDSILNSQEEDFTKKLLWIVHLADCLSASERSIVEGNTELSPKNPLLSIFYFLNFSGEKFQENELYYNDFPLRIGEILFPENIGNKRNISLSKYSEIKSLLEEFDPEISFDLWLILLERFTSFVPAMTGEKEIVSLFDHSKMTSAFSACLFQYYKNEIFSKSLTFETFKEITEKEILGEENKKVFLLIGGDLSGIQKFVYGTTHHHKALLRTKGRSLYLEFLCLDVIREILNQLNLTWANVILNSGGHFYILTPNLDEVKKKKIETIKKEVNKFLYEKFGGTIYLALACQEFSGKEISKPFKANKEDLKRRGEAIKEIFKELYRKLDDDKSQRFKDILLNNLNLWKEKTSYEDNLCQFCKLRPGEKKDFKGEKLRECKECENFREMAKKFRAEREEELEKKEFWIEFIEKMRYQKIGVWKEKEFSEDSPCFEFRFSKFYLKDFKENFEIKNDFKAITLINFYNFEDKEIKYKLKSLFNQLKNKNFNFLNSYFVSWYSTEYAEELDVIDTGCIGLKKIAILKADVDNLGEIFKEGIDIEYKTFSSLATFSRFLDWFFKIYINWLGHIEKGLKQNINETQSSLKTEFKKSLGWREKLKKPKRDIQILYSGGDDLVVIGPWNEILDFALDLEWLFKEYVGKNPNLHFSAGMVIVDKKFPIYRAIELAEERLKEAKREKEKNKFSLFERKPVFWKEVRESFQDFSDFLEFNPENKKIKLKYLSKSFLYKLLELRDGYFEKEEKGVIDLKPIIYIHYLLARSKKKKLKDNEIIKKYIALQRSGKPTKEFQYLDLPLVWLSYLSREK